MKALLEGAGIFIYPLLACSSTALFVFIERYLALAPKYIMPQSYWQQLCSDQKINISGDNHSVASRIVQFFTDTKSDLETLKAFIQLEVTRMERGLFLLDAIVTIAPLLGLLGTVVGLFQVFSQLSLADGLPDAGVFVKGIALALTTTMMGLMIAIPAVFGNSFLLRKVEVYVAQINVLAEKLVHQKAENGTQI